MKPLLVNSHSHQGGAAIATQRLHWGLRDAGIESKLLVQRGQSEKKSVLGPKSLLGEWVGELRYKANYLPLWKRYLLEDQPSLFSPTWVPDHLSARIDSLSPDILHLHWVSGFMRPDTIRNIDVPVVWTLHDMWPFTGGCHYAGGCQRYQDKCGNCPELNSGTEDDRSRLLWKRKQEAWKDQELVVVAPSTWMATKAEESSLLDSHRVTTIPNGLDLERYRPVKRDRARNALSIETDDKLILFTCADDTPRKGQDHLLEALNKLELEPDSHSLLAFGSTEGELLDQTSYKVHDLGYIDSVKVPLVYSATDVSVVPSKQDNLPNTVAESLACGTPCVAFDIGGIPDMIGHKQNGYLATPFEEGDLADGIEWTLRHEQQLSNKARDTAKEKFDIKSAVSQYHSLYQSLTGESEV